MSDRLFLLAGNPSGIRSSLTHVVDAPRLDNFVYGGHSLDGIHTKRSCWAPSFYQYSLVPSILSLCYALGEDQLLELHPEVMLWGRIPSRACPPWSPFVGFFCPLHLRCRFVDSHRLGSGGCPWPDRGHEALLLHYAVICGNVC